MCAKYMFKGRDSEGTDGEVEIRIYDVLWEKKE